MRSNSQGSTVAGFGGEVSSLKTRLLTGVAGFALAAGGAPLALADEAMSEPSKWQPYLELSGKLGDETQRGAVQIFVPLWQDSTSLFFGRAVATFDDEDQSFGTIGGGYRTMVNPEWILGAYGFYDFVNTKEDHSFDQFSVGVEFLSEDWDFRANAYFADDTREDVDRLNGVYLGTKFNTSIQIHRGIEAAYSGVDGEVGYRVFSGETFETRVFLGGFHFESDEVAFDDLTGPRGRIEARIYDIDFLGPQSRVTLTGEITDDNVRDTEGYVGLEIRIPLGFGEETPALTGLDRRMVDPVRRYDAVYARVGLDEGEDIIASTPLGDSNVTDTLVYVRSPAPIRVLSITGRSRATVRRLKARTAPTTSSSWATRTGSRTSTLKAISMRRSTASIQRRSRSPTLRLMARWAANTASISARLARTRSAIRLR